jgi:hypothetical protein
MPSTGNDGETQRERLTPGGDVSSRSSTCWTLLRCIGSGSSRRSADPLAPTCRKVGDPS